MKSKEEVATHEPTSITLASPTVEIREVNFEQYQDVLKEQRGKIVVVDMWATWCPPCVKEFPNLVALAKKESSNDVACISFNLDHQGIDELSLVKKEVLGFLEKADAKLTNLMSVEESDTIFKKLGVKSIPVVEVYDRSGKLLKRFDASSEKEFTYREVEEAVAEAKRTEK